MAAEPPKWAPPQASDRAKALWEEGFWSRVRRFITPNPQIVDDYLPIMIESFNYQQFRYAVENNYNLLPEVDQKSMLTHPLFGGPVRAVIRKQWPYLRDALLNPSGLREKMRHFDPMKASLFDTPQGFRWFCWFSYHTLWLLYDRARIGQKIEPNMRVAPPPYPCPLHQGLCGASSETSR